MSRSRIVVGLEVGTSKVCTVIGEQRDDNAIAVIGVGECPSRGIRKAEVVDLDTAIQCVHQSVQAAEESAGVEIRTVFAGVSGSHIHSFNSRGMVPVMGENGEITDADVDAVLKNALAVKVPLENFEIHTLCHDYNVDGQDGVQKPQGMRAMRLQADVHVIHGVESRAQNVVKCIQSVPPLTVKEVVFNGYAASLAVLTEEQMQLGAVVIDIGGGTTNFAVYVRGAVRHSGVIAVGGDHIANDIAIGLKLPLSRAERLKVEHGGVQLDDSMKGRAIAPSGELRIGTSVVFQDQLCTIMRLRVEEMLQLVKQELDESGWGEFIGAGVFLTGGCAHIRGIKELAAEIFRMPIHIGTAQTVMGLTTPLQRPEYAAPIGIMLNGVQKLGPMLKHQTLWEKIKNIGRPA